MNSKYLTYVAVVVAIVSVLSAAFIYIDMQNQIDSLKNNNNNNQAISVVDDEGNALTLSSVPQRIVSVAPSNTQILFAVGAGDRVVGVTDWDSYPYNFSAWIEAGNMTSIGGYSTPNKEVIASLHPDLIVATPINDVDIATLRASGYKVLVLNPNGVTGVLKDIAMVGTATGTEANASALVNSLNSQISAVTAKIIAANITEKPTVYYEVWAGTSYMTIGANC
jgi:iron complex transport system substrate-binding protein